MLCIWGSASKGNIRTIENVIRFAGRFVLKKRKYDSVKNEITTNLKWLFPKQLYKFELLKIVFMIHNNMCPVCPAYFTNYLQIDECNIGTLHTRNNSYSYRIAETSESSSYGTRSFTQQAHKEWLLLPTHIRESRTLSKFKIGLCNHLLNEQKQECDINLSDFSHYDEVIEDVIKYWIVF